MAVSNKEVCSALLHMTSSRNQTPDVLILSPTAYLVHGITSYLLCLFYNLFLNVSVLQQPAWGIGKKGTHTH